MTLEWKTNNDLVDYKKALDFMEDRVNKIIKNTADELIWLLHHDHIYTGGTSAQACDILNRDIPVYHTGRGGQYTYHGPGQRIAYAMINLKNRQAEDIRLYIHNLEEWIIRTLAKFDIKGERREGRIGIWVVCPDGEERKIAAIGVRLRKWVTFHGIAINLNPDLSYFEGIVPCGISNFGVTSIHQLGKPITMEELDEALKQSWAEIFE